MKKKAQPSPAQHSNSHVRPFLLSFISTHIPYIIKNHNNTNPTWKKKCYRTLEERPIDLDDDDLDRPRRSRRKMDFLAGAAEAEADAAPAAPAGCDLDSSPALFPRCRATMKLSRWASNASKQSCVAMSKGDKNAEHNSNTKQKRKLLTYFSMTTSKHKKNI